MKETTVRTPEREKLAKAIEELAAANKHHDDSVTAGRVLMTRKVDAEDELGADRDQDTK